MSNPLRIWPALLFSSLLLLTACATVDDNPYAENDGDWIDVSGTVVSSNEDSFVLDYGSGTITVEMDDWDWYKEGWTVIKGDHVIVHGRIDDDLFQARTIEASSVYVKDLNTYFYASAADEEVIPYYIVTYTTPTRQTDDVYWTYVTGRVTDINGREFTLDTGTRTIRIDTSAMPYDPLDNSGFQKVRVGDRVSVGGKLDPDLFDKREIVAASIITLQHDKRKARQG